MWLNLPLGYRTVKWLGNLLPQRNILSFGTGAVVVDDPVNLATSVTVSPTSLASSGWVQSAFVDFTQQASQTLGTDGNYSLGGVTFQKINSANESTATVLTNGTGIVIKPVSASNYQASGRTLPAFRTVLSSLIPNFTDRVAFRAWLYIAAINPQANFDNCTFAAEDGGASNTGLNFHQRYQRTFSSGQAFFTTQTLHVADAAGITDTTNTSDNVMVIEAPWGCFGPYTMYSGTYASGFPAMSAVRPRAVWPSLGDTSVYQMSPVSNFGILFGAERAGSASSTFAATIGAFRLEYR